MRPRVLVVEDTPLNTDLILQLLEDDYELEHVEDGQSAIHRALEACSSGAPFDLILLDLSIPKVDGIEVTRRLHEREGFDTPIVAVTAHAMVGDRERALAAGCRGYITKPIDENQLFATLTAILGPPDGS